MKSYKELAELLTGSRTENYQSKRQSIGFGVVGGFFIAFVGCMLTRSVWWFLVPIFGFFGAWRMVMGHWPLFQKRKD